MERAARCADSPILKYTKWRKKYRCLERNASDKKRETGSWDQVTQVTCNGRRHVLPQFLVLVENLVRLSKIQCLKSQGLKTIPT